MNLHPHPAQSSCILLQFLTTIVTWFNFQPVLGRYQLLNVLADTSIESFENFHTSLILVLDLL
jgi:hypothetical protein